MESSAGWSIHLIVLGALAAVGVALTVFDYAGASSGGPISLRGAVSMLFWMGFAAFAVSSTATFALLRSRLGVLLAYAAALPLAAAAGAVVWSGWRAIEQPLARKADENRVRELASRLTLESWSISEEPGGIVRFRAVVRAERDGSVEFEPSAGIGGYVAVDRATRTPERALRAGERGIFESTARRTAEGALDAFDFFFVSRLAVPDSSVAGGIAYGETGNIAFTSDTRKDVLGSGGLLKRPLPRSGATHR